MIWWPEVLAGRAGELGAALGDSVAEPGLAVGRSFIEPSERPAVGEAAIREPREA